MVSNKGKVKRSYKTLELYYSYTNVLHVRNLYISDVKVAGEPWLYLNFQNAWRVVNFFESWAASS